MRDYLEWHEAYADPGSALSWRLRTVQGYIDEALDRTDAPVTVVSACAGDGRDLLEVLGRRADAARVTATLVEIDPRLAARARRTAAATSARVEVRTADAGCTDAYAGAVPADLVIMMGIFGNISDADLQATIAAAPQLCHPGATLLWSRSRAGHDLDAAIRDWFAAAGFTELHHAMLASGVMPTVGAMRYAGPTQPLVPSQRWFTFLR